MLRRGVGEALRKAGMLRAAFRIYEFLEVLKASVFNYNDNGRSPAFAPDGLPIPPLKSVMSVIGEPDRTWFLESGRLTHQSILGILKKNNLEFSRFGDVLEFGCGCGRIIRYLRPYGNIRLHGADYNANSINWCRRNLNFAEYIVNCFHPPLGYSGEKFDFIYMISVITHLPEKIQFLWIKELYRIIKPGGYLLFSTLGEYCFKELLSEEEEKRFRKGELIIRYEEGAGSNLCLTFHPYRYIAEKLSRGFELIDYHAGAASGRPSQDIYLLKKPVV